MAKENDIMNKLVSLAKRRGFIFPTAEKYGGLGGFWDWGPLGVELKNNIKKSWWRRFVQERADMVGLDSAIITNPKVWEASGHIQSFSDRLVECKKCQSRYKSDQLINYHFAVTYNAINLIQKNVYKLIQLFLEDNLNISKNKADVLNDLNSNFSVFIGTINKYSGREKEIILLYFINAAKEAYNSIEYDIDIDKEGNYQGGSDYYNSYIQRFSKDNLKDLAEDLYIDKEIKCKKCGKRDWSLSRNFNTMFKTFVGPVEDSASEAYLRPETAQNIFVNFENVLNSSRMKVPFGIAQIGKAFRNEITPGNFIFRSREFEQMEIEFFIDPSEDKKWFDYWVKESKQWFLDLGIKKENIKERKQGKDELAHYAKETSDLEYNWPFEKGFSELIGIANRTDYDLKAHGFKYKDEKQEFVPYVIEPSFGVERPTLAFLLDAYAEIEGGRTKTTESTKEKEVVLRLHKDLAPIKVAILPLSKKEPISKLANKIYDELRPAFICAYDEVASIGRRYRRQDEIGTPYCVTVDFDSLEDKKVTVRDRDSMKQDRVDIAELNSYLAEKLN